jgi:murein DD-endopeptidase MepM/ murein hydrolase activator NlpD
MRLVALACVLLGATAASSTMTAKSYSRPSAKGPNAMKIRRQAGKGIPAMQATETLVPLQAGAPEPPLAFTFPQVDPEPGLDWRPGPYPVPWALRPEDHFFFYRPIESGEVNWPLARYRYGSTYNGDEKTHTGVDLDASLGTPVLAAGSGEVVWAGFGLARGRYDPEDPYGEAVVIHHDFGFRGQDLYTVYAHLRTINVWVGQKVAALEPIGEVGTTGRSTGPHLHFEVRVGKNSYFQTRNPELWMVPPQGYGVLAGRLESRYGYPLEEFTIHIWSLESGEYWQVWTYALDTVNPDADYQENFVISDLPAGPYEVRVDYLWQVNKAQFFLEPGRTTFILFRGGEGFLFEDSTGEE